MTGDLETLTPAQVATLLQVHVRTVKRWLVDQSLPGFQLQSDAGKAGDWRVRRVDLERWMAERGREQRDGPEVMESPPAAVAGT